MPEEKYLQLYAEPFVRNISPLYPEEKFDQVLVIPACQEKLDLPECLSSAMGAADQQGIRLLLIVVLNNAKDCPPSVFIENRDTLEILLEGEVVQPGLDSPTTGWLIKKENHSLWVLDHYSPGREIPRKQGVGLARKLGCDLAFALWHRSQIASPWLRTSDADALFPIDYFCKLPYPEKGLAPSAGTFPFWHKVHQVGLDSTQQKALLLYEIHLRYHRLGLAWAGSAYGYHTIGSTLAFTFASYARVRGFPKRPAGEDFHLLNKLAKMAPVISLRGEPITIRGRPSDRVPFGTGPAMATISEKIKRKENYTLYHPDLYRHLKALLESINEALHSASFNPLETKKPDRPDPQAWQVFEDLGGVEELRQTMEKAGSPKARKKRMADWFDGLKTIRFMHLLRDRHFPSLVYHQALNLCPFLDVENINEHTDLASLRQALAEQDQKTPVPSPWQKK